MGDEKPHPPDGTSGVTRRGLIKGIATAVTAASTGATALLVETRRELQAANPSGPMAVSVTVNGALKTGSFEPRTTLAEALRDAWGLTGTKVGCDRGACGACTVLLDGLAVNSCLTLVHDADGRKVTTVEGLGSPEAMAPIQKAFVDADALQCGFCTPGLVVSCAGLLAKNARPSAHDVREAVAGNLCRCGTYAGVFAACEAAAKAGVKHG
ncbi:MAG TPA: (2Fe-2S)-binding protein [Thermoanaerobaculia bacterium]|jgi:aerobic-type carbon monoxide dehydrogenase small subunit (CoxS/CutS family)|nr:(2Fe-2S)-binding protein [Thermoanaerobaculia bacterium]